MTTYITPADDNLVSPESYYRIWGFMTGELGLKKSELLIYALIYSYFKNAQPFTASQKYISEFTGASRSTTEETLKSLIGKGLIHKRHTHERGRAVIEYTIAVEALPNIGMHRDMRDMLARDAMARPRI